MDFLLIEGVRPYDGRYPLDLEGQEFTTREWGFIKRLSSYLPLTASEGFAQNDPELVCAIAVILLRRAGKIETKDVPAVFDRLADAPYTATLRWELDTGAEPEGDADADPTASSSGSTNTSGPASTPSSESSDDRPSRTGMPGWASSESVPATSVS